MADHCTTFSVSPFSYRPVHRLQKRLNAPAWRLVRLLGSLFLVVAAGLVSGCAYVDNFAPRADTINRSITDYRNEATFLNIIRASYSEPMDFVTVTGATGHSTFNGSQGLPTFIIGPHTAPTATNPVAARNYVFGPNSIQESASTDFNVSLLDDPQSYVALMTPIDAGMISFFQRSGTPLPVLLPLVISEIRFINKSDNKAYAFVTDQGKRTFLFCADDQAGFFCKWACSEEQGICKSINSRDNDAPPNIRDLQLRCHANQGRCIPPALFATAYLTARGIRFQVPIGTIPGQQQSTQTSVRICFDRVYTYRRPASVDEYLGYFIKDPEFAKIKYYSDFPEVDSYRSVMPAAFHDHFKCEDKDTPWIPLGGADSAQRQSGAANPAFPSSLCINAGCGASRATSQPAVRNAKKSPQAAIYEFSDGSSIIQIFTRPTWGIYQFLGNLMERQEIDGTVSIVDGGLRGDQSLFRVVRGGRGECFVSVTYSGEIYCIPKDAYNSKRIISVVHELANLYTKPNNLQQPNTGTTRITQ